jgi:linoleoyl-CoA desaturase
MDRAKKSSLIKVTFNNKNDSGFATVLKQRVDAYFQSGNISKYANAHMVLKTLFYFGGWLGVGGLVLSGHFSGPVMLLMMLVLGVFGAGIGFNIGHDAIHGSYSAHPRVNQMVSLAFEMVGANAYTWRIRHNILHHTYTNVMGSDGDLESMPLLRFCLKPGRRWFHAYQHFYAPILYCFTSLVWVFKKDYKHILEERHDQRLKKKPPVHVYISLVGFKILHYFLFLILPFWVLDISVGQVVTGFLAMHFVLGFLLATVFQLGHCVEGPEFLNYPASGQINDSWAEHQLKTSSNFGSHFLNTWFCGGLNFQIEHHLFTGICHVHYKALSQIVRQTAREHNLPYNEFPSFFAGVRSHFKMLKFFGRNDPVPAQAVAA